MNKIQEEGLIDLVCDFLINSSNIHKIHTYSITAYRDSKMLTTKVPIRFRLEESPIDHLVIDFLYQKVLDDCDGITVYDTYIRLNCDLAKFEKIGFVDYIVDKRLTDLLNQKFAPDENP